MDFADPQPTEEPLERTPSPAAVFVVTHAFGPHQVGDEVSAEIADTAPAHAVVRRGQTR